MIVMAPLQEFLTSAGIQVNAPEEFPQLQANSSSVLEKDEKSLRPRTAAVKKHPLKQFLQHDGQVLR